MSDEPVPDKEEETSDGLFTISASGLTATEIDSLRAWKKSMDERRSMDGRQAAEIRVESSPGRGRRSKSLGPRVVEDEWQQARHARNGTTGDLTEALRAQKSRKLESDALSVSGRPMSKAARRLDLSEPRSPFSNNRVFSADDNFPLDRSAVRASPNVRALANQFMSLERARTYAAGGHDPERGGPPQRAFQSTPPNYRRVDASVTVTPPTTTTTILDKNSQLPATPNRLMPGGDQFLSPNRDYERSSFTPDHTPGRDRGERGLYSPSTDRYSPSSSRFSDRGLFVDPDNVHRSPNLAARRALIDDVWREGAVEDRKVAAVAAALAHREAGMTPSESSSIPQATPSSSSPDAASFLEKPPLSVSNRALAAQQPSSVSPLTTTADSASSAETTGGASTPTALFATPSTALFNIPERLTPTAASSSAAAATSAFGAPSSSPTSTTTAATFPATFAATPTAFAAAAAAAAASSSSSPPFAFTPTGGAVNTAFGFSPATAAASAMSTPSPVATTTSPFAFSSAATSPLTLAPATASTPILGAAATPPFVFTSYPTNDKVRSLTPLHREQSLEHESSRLLAEEGEESTTTTTTAPALPASGRRFNTPGRFTPASTRRPSPDPSQRGSVSTEDEPLRKFKPSMDSAEFAVPPSRDVDIEYFKGGEAEGVAAGAADTKKRRRENSAGVEYFNKDVLTMTPSSALRSSPNIELMQRQQSGQKFVPLPTSSKLVASPASPAPSTKPKLSVPNSPGSETHPLPNYVGVLRHEVSVISFARAHSWKGLLVAILGAYWFATCIASAALSGAWTPPSASYTWEPAVLGFVWALLALLGLACLLGSFLWWRARVPTLRLNPKEKCFQDLVRDVHDDISGAQSKELAANYIDSRVMEKAKLLSARSDWDVDLGGDLQELVYRFEPAEQSISTNLFLQFLTDLSPSRVKRAWPCSVHNSQFQNLRGLLHIGLLLLLSYCLMLTCQLPLPRVISFQIIVALVALASLCAIAPTMFLMGLQCVIILAAGTFPLVQLGSDTASNGNCQFDSTFSASLKPFSLRPLDILQLGFVPHIVSLLLLCAMCQQNAHSNVIHILNGRRQTLSESLAHRLVNASPLNASKPVTWRGPLIAIFFVAVAWGVCIAIVVVGELWYGQCATTPACTQPRFLCGFDMWHACTCLDTELCMNNQSLSSVPDLRAWNRLNYLDVSHNYLSDLPDYLCTVPQLTLIASSNSLKSVPACFGTAGITALNLSYNSLTSFPDTAASPVNHLVSLDLSHNRLQSFAVQSPSLRTLALSFNNISSLEVRAPALTSLDITRNPVRKIEGLESLASLTELRAPHTELSELTSDFYKLGRLRECDLSNNRLQQLPTPPDSGMTNPALVTLNLAGNKLRELPTLAPTGWFKSLESLDLSSNALTGLPATLGDFSMLQYLSVQNNMIQALAPSVLQGLSSLRTFLVSFNSLARLPSQLSRLTALTRLDVTRNLLETIPGSLGNLTKLRHVSLGSNALSSMPDLHWTNMESLDLSRNKLKSGDLDFLARLTRLQVLSLRENMITSWVNSTAALNLLTRLDLSKNAITSLPASLSGLNQLQQLDLSGNLLTSLPQSLSDLEFLAELQLSNNKIEVSPFEVASNNSAHRLWCPLLKSLDLSKNRMANFPYDVKSLRQLETLDVSNNPIAEFPAWLSELPVLSRLRASRLNITAQSKKNSTLLPACGGHLVDVDISYNALRELDNAFVSSCAQQLIALDASYNLLQVLPDSFVKMTSLTTLRLLSNPMCANQYCNWAPSGIKAILETTDACGA